MAKSHPRAPRKNPPANEARRYRLYPSEAVDERMTGWGHTRRAIYNLALEQRRAAWHLCKTTVYSTAQCRDLTELRAAYDWVREMPVAAAQQCLRDLDQAYRNFWREHNRSGHPAFAKRSGALRFRIPGNQIEVRRLNRRFGEVKVPKAGWVRFRWTRPLGGHIANATFTKKAGQWHVSFAVAVPRALPGPNGKPGVGVDFGIACSAYVSGEDAPRIKPPSFIKGEQRRLVGLERRKARQVHYAKGYNGGRYSARLRRTIDDIAALHARAARRRLDFTHKLTTDLAKNHGFVGIEDLAVKNMTRSAKGTKQAPGKRVAQKSGLNRALLDNMAAERRRQLAYKAPWYGSRLVVVAPAGTSQTCAKCGVRDPQSRQGCGRLFACTSCGHVDHADANAATVIRQRALVLLGAQAVVDAALAGGPPVHSTGGTVVPSPHLVGDTSVNHLERELAVAA